MKQPKLILVNDRNVMHYVDATKQCIKGPTNKATRVIHVDHRHQQLNTNKAKFYCHLS